MNCTKVWIYGGAFASSSIHGHFENIGDLVIFENAFSNSEGRIFIERCHIDELQRLHANFREIKFNDTSIDVIRKNAFDVLEIPSIIFENCRIGTIEANAMTNKVRAAVVIGETDF